MKNNWFWNGISVPFDSALLSISGTEINSSSADPKFGSSVSHYLFRVYLSLPSLTISFREAEE